MRIFDVRLANPVPVSTTGAVAANVVGFDLASLPGGVPQNLGFFVRGVVVGSDGTNVIGAECGRAFKTASGSLSALGTVAAVAAPTGDAALTTMALTIGVSGSSIVLQATGVALITINWTGFLHVYSAEF